MISSDGRHQRGARSRAAIVEAVLEFLRSGETSPSSTEIAARAGVTQRTLFNHFDDMESLMREVVTRHAELILPLVPLGDPTGALIDRIEAFTEPVCQIAEDSQNVRWAAMTHPDGERYGRAGVQFMRDLLRERLVATFAPEIDRLAADRQAVAIAALELEIDPLVWRLRRQQNGQNFNEALQTVRHVFEVTLSPTAGADLT